jgi:acetolactate synthase-1/2/3 large subunit
MRPKALPWFSATASSVAASDSNSLPAWRMAPMRNAKLYCLNNVSRIERGSGRPLVERLAYFPWDLDSQLSKHDVVVFVDVDKVATNFDYANRKSVQPTHESIFISFSCLSMLTRTAVDPNTRMHIPNRPALPRGRCTAHSMCQVVAHLQPEDTILVDESLTSGASYWEHSAASRP